MRTRYWVMFFAGLLIVCSLISVFLFTKKTTGTIANLYQDGVCIYSVDLSSVKEAYEFTVRDDRGYNTIRVEPGRIRVLEADCRDEVCVKTGWTEDHAAPIVCLPHRLVIRIEETAKNPDGIDAVAW